MYGVFTTPENAIGGNAICAFQMEDILASFEGPFKEQETANSNWLPVSKIIYITFYTKQFLCQGKRYESPKPSARGVQWRLN